MIVNTPMMMPPQASPGAHVAKRGLTKRNDFIPEVTIRQNVGKKGLIKAVQVQYSGRYFKDTYAKSGRPGELLQRCGLTAKDIERAVRAVMKRKVG